MDVASTSGRICLTLSEAIYYQRISSFFSRSDVFKATKAINYEQRSPTTASASRCRGRAWRHHRHSNRWTSLTPPAAVSAGFRQDCAQHHYERPVVTTPADIATSRRTAQSRGRRRGLSASSAAALDSYSPTNAAATGRDLSSIGFPVHPNAAAAAIDNTVTSHRLHHTLVADAVDAIDDDAGVEDGTGLQHFRPPMPIAAASPPLRLQPPQAPRLNPVAQAALNRQITDCTDWLALEALYRSLRSPSLVSGSSSASAAATAASSPLGGPQLVAMARHLARLPRHCSFAKFEDERLQLFASELAAATIPYLGEMAQGEYCALLWAYGKIGCHPGLDFLSAILPLLQPLLPAAGPTGLSQALWGLARMGHVPPEPFLCDFYDAAARALRTPFANPQHVSNLLWAMVMLRLQAPPELISEALAVLDRKLLAATPQALAITAWAVVQVGERSPPEAWWHRIQQAALQLKGKLQPQDISHLVWATARSGYPGPQPWLHAMCSEAHGCMKGFRSQELCNLLWGFVVVGFKPPEPWLTATISAAQNLLPSFKGFELAVLLWCLASLQAKPLLPRTFARALFFHSAPKLRFFSAQDCANVIWSLARLQLRPPEPWMAAFVEESFTQLPRFTPQHLANTIWGFARLSRCPPEPWMDRFFLESRPLLLSFKTAELAMLAMALGIARLDPPRQWLNQMLVASYSKLEHCRAQELANLVWGFWRLFFKPPQRWLDAVATAASRLTEQGAMSATDLITLGRAFSAFGAELPANVRQALKAAEEAQLLLQMPQQGVEAKRQQLVLGVQQQTGRPQTAGLQPPSSEQGHQQQQPKAMRQRKPPKPNRQEHPDLSFQQRQPQQERRQLEKQLHDPTLDGTQHSGEEAGMQPGVRCVASAAVRGQGLRQQSGREQASERVDNVPGQTSGEQRTNHVIPSAVASSCKPARLLELPSADMARSTGSSGVMEVVVSEHDPVASTTAIAIAASAVAAPEPLATGEAVLSATAAGSEGAGRVITVQGSRAEAGSAETRPRAASGAVRGAIEPVRKEAEAGKQAAAVDQTSAVTKTEVVGMATQSQPVLGSHFRDVLNFATANVHSEAEGVERRREKRRRDRQVKRRLAVRSDGMPAAITDSDAANAGVSDAVTVSSANGDKAAMDSSQLPPTLAESVSPSASLSAPLSLTSPSELPEIPAAQAALPSGNGRVSDMESSASGAASPLPSLSATAAANDFVASGTDSVTCYGTLRVANGSSAVDEARAALEPVEQSIDSLQLVSVSDLGFAELEGHAASPKAASEAADVMPLQTTARATRAAARRRARERALQQQTGAALLPVLE